MRTTAASSPSSTGFCTNSWNPAVQRPALIFGLAVGRQRYGGHIIDAVHAHRADAPDEGIAVLAGHAEIADQHVGPEILQHLECFPRRSHGCGSRAALRQRHRHQFPRIRIVVHDQHLHAAQGLRVRGQVVGRLLNGTDRQMHGEAGAEAAPIALRLDAPAVQFDDVANDGEAETEPAVRPGDRAVALRKTVEDERQQFRLNALAGVADLDDRARADARDARVRPDRRPA